VLQERGEDYEYLSKIQKVARALVEHDYEADLKTVSREDAYIEYVAKLSRMLTPDSSFRQHFLKTADKPNPLEYSEIQLAEKARAELLCDMIFAAAAFNKLSLAEEAIPEYVKLRGKISGASSTFYGVPHRVSALAGHHEVFDLIMRNSDTMRVHLWRAICLQLVSRAGSPRTVAFILQSDWEPTWTFRDEENGDERDETIRNMDHNTRRFRRAQKTPNVECFELIREAWEKIAGKAPLTEHRLLELLGNAKKEGWEEMEQHLTSLLEQQGHIFLKTSKRDRLVNYFKKVM